MLRGLDHACPKKEKSDLFDTPTEFLESFICVFTSIDDAVKETKLNEIWTPYKPSIQKLQGEMDACISDQSGEAQQK